MPFRHKQLALAVLFLAAGPPDRLTAQVTWTARLGATLTSTMVNDQIAGSQIKLAPGTSPTLSVEAATPLHGKGHFDATGEVLVALGTLERTEGDSTTDVADLRTVAVTAGLRGYIRPALTLRAGFGVLAYGLSEKTGIFGSGRPLTLLGTAALERRFKIGQRLAISTLLRYDLHGFTTKQLRDNGYTGSQTVHRVTFGVGVSR